MKLSEAVDMQPSTVTRSLRNDPTHGIGLQIWWIKSVQWIGVQGTWKLFAFWKYWVIQHSIILRINVNLWKTQTVPFCGRPSRGHPVWTTNPALGGTHVDPLTPSSGILPSSLVVLTHWGWDKFLIFYKWHIPIHILHGNCILIQSFSRFSS